MDIDTDKYQAEISENLKIDANICLPNTDTLPIYTANYSCFSVDQIKQICGAFFSENVIYHGVQGPTKEYYVKRIETLNEEISNLKTELSEYKDREIDDSI